MLLPNDSRKPRLFVHNFYKNTQAKVNNIMSYAFSAVKIKGTNPCLNLFSLTWKIGHGVIKVRVVIVQLASAYRRSPLQ